MQDEVNSIVKEAVLNMGNDTNLFSLLGELSSSPSSNLGQDAQELVKQARHHCRSNKTSQGMKDGLAQIKALKEHLGQTYGQVRKQIFIYFSWNLKLNY